MTDVLTTSREQHARFSSDDLRCPIAQRYVLDGPDLASTRSPIQEYPQRDSSPSPIISSASSSIPSSPDLSLSAIQRLPSSPTTLSSPSLSLYDEQEDRDTVLPSHATITFVHKEESCSKTSVNLPVEVHHWRSQAPAVDDYSIEEEPSRHVDYLSHEWREEDIWASWRYVVSRRIIYENGLRLENASWRTWAKMRLNLSTVSPDTLNWLKDCDVTWLYGPLKTHSNIEKPTTSPPPSCLETPTFSMDRKPILKKRTASESILQRSLSQHTLLQHAGAILKAQEADLSRTRPSLGRHTSKIGALNRSSDGIPQSSLTDTSTNTSSGTDSPSDRRHIHFNDEVVQCIAVEAKGDEEDVEWLTTPGDDDDGLVMMKQISPHESVGGGNIIRSSSNGDNKTIAPLPSTTLKYRKDTSESPVCSIMDRWTEYFSTPSLSSDSTKAYWYSDQSADFFSEEDHEDICTGLDSKWECKHCSRNPADQNHPWFMNTEDEEELAKNLSFSQSELPTSPGEGGQSYPDMFDKIIDAVNTARDIAHVIWNVGWRR